MKNHFLAVYDYGTGGLWAVFDARSKEEISAKFPELKVYDQGLRPSWMPIEQLERIEKSRFMDIDDEPTGWFAELIKNRK